jgi:hypothetical protein
MALNYEPLDVESYEIRMLTILPGAPDSTIRCTLEKTNLITPSKYAALSYCWGELNITTNICVNNVEVAVTVNLADALQRLRLLGVTRVWADALCINQEDRQEKSHQIRNMAHVYSKADKTYAWLGRESTDNLTAAMLFLQTLVLAQDDTALADIPHTHTTWTDCTSRWPSNTQPMSMIAARMPTNETTLHNESCKRCLHEDHFRKLLNFFNAPYWKRRWIIQEITVSWQVQLLCSQAKMSIDKMEAAINLCRKSCYWHAETETSYLFIKRIMEFRHSYQAGGQISLSKAIAMSQESLSTDPRDKIFAMLGICHDGAELVPIPNYQQPLEAIVKEVTRTLLWKGKYLEALLINRSTAAGSSLASLPSWVPDGFSLDSPEDSYVLANKQLASWGKFREPDSITENCDVFQVQGVTIGTIVAATSAIDGKGSPGQSLDPSPPPTAYYKSDVEILRALFSCLTTREGLTKIKPTVRIRFTCSRPHLVWHAFYIYLTGYNTIHWDRKAEPRQDFESSVPRGLLLQWFEANASLLIQRKTLKRWVRQPNFWAPLMRILDTRGCLIFVWVMFILEFVCGGYTSTYMQTLLPIACLGPFAVFQILAYLWYGVEISRLLSEIWLNMGSVLQTPKKLVICDKGFIGMACAGAQPGDKICFLAGRTSPVLLREMRSGGRVQHTVVGDIYVYLSKSDRKFYDGFTNQKCYSHLSVEDDVQRMYTKVSGTTLWGDEVNSKEWVYPEERIKCVERYREEGILKEYKLI